MLKETVYKVLLALGAVATFFGLGNLVGAVDFLVVNLDQLWASVLFVVGAVTTLFAFFKSTPAPVGTAAEDTKTVVSQVLLALGAVAAFLGLAKLTDVVNYLLVNLDTLWASVTFLVGVVTTLIGYLNTKEKV